MIENMNWRYATKKFDPEKRVDDVDLNRIKKVIQLSASSYGLQPYRVLCIENPSLREKLKSASWNQPQITDASHLFVFCHYIKVRKEDIDAFIELKAKIQNKEINELDSYGSFINQKLSQKSDIEVAQWTAKQTYIALANLLTICAELKIDACPMEGFDPELYDDILGLKDQNLSASVVATIGYRLEDDQSQYLTKVRRPLDQLFEVI
jgi:nitroreductase